MRSEKRSQAIPRSITGKSGAIGGNIFGLNAEDDIFCISSCICSPVFL